MAQDYLPNYLPKLKRGMVYALAIIPVPLLALLGLTLAAVLDRRAARRQGRQARSMRPAGAS